MYAYICRHAEYKHTIIYQETSGEAFILNYLFAFVLQMLPL